MTMQKIILGNWKMHGSKIMLQQLIHGIRQMNFDAQKVVVGILPPFVYLPEAQQLLQHSQIKLGAQNVSEHELGAYTGEIAATMLKEFHCDYVLVGHSERRHIFGESDQQVAAKFWRAIEAGLVPVLCVGETLIQRDNNETQQILQVQLDAVFENEKTLIPSQFIIAYEPVWAIGSGKTATIDQVQQVHQFIQKVLTKSHRPLTAILYGGSVKPDNAHALMQIPEVNGVLVGGASLDVQQFNAIIATV